MARYADLLERRFLNRVALRREDLEYRTLFDERLIGPELSARSAAICDGGARRIERPAASRSRAGTRGRSSPMCSCWPG